VEHAGVIEGFYGPPWSWEARLEVAGEVAAAGGDLYVYAPKDDPLHRARWREAYPADVALELERFATTAPLACGFALSPGLDIDLASADDRARLVAKLCWSASIGFELVVLALDDIPIAPGSGLAHGRLWCEVAEALDPVPVLLVPSDYTGVAPTPYLDGLVAGIGAAPCSIGWTGPLVVNDEITAAQARGRAEACGGRRPARGRLAEPHGAGARIAADAAVRHGVGLRR
jgi:hyaluronoglucosaminidase